MSCKYLYKGVEYTKEEIIQLLSNNSSTVNTSLRTLRSVATKPKTSDIINDSIKLMYQRRTDAINMKKVIQNNPDLSKKEKLEKLFVYDEIIANSKETIKALSTITPSKQIELILEMAENDVKFVEAAFASNNLNLDDFQFINNIVETWNNINSVLGITSVTQIKNDVLKTRLTDIKNKYNIFEEQARLLAISLIEKSVKGGKITKEELAQIQDTTYATEQFRELSTAGVPITNKLAYIIKEINLKVNRDHNKNYERIDRMFEIIKNNPLFKSKGFELFVKKQKDKYGNEKLALVTKYSQEFWDNYRKEKATLRTALEKAADDKTKIKDAYDVFNRWQNKNTLHINALYFIKSADYTDAERNAEINRFKALGFNDTEINDMIHESLKLYSRFISDRETYEFKLQYNALKNPSLIGTSKTIDDYIKEKLAEYDSVNDPVVYYDQKFKGALTFTAYGAASKYVYLIPAKTVDGKDSNYYDKNFSEIQSDKDLYNFYNEYLKFMRECLSWLPEEETMTLGSNFLPVLAERTAREYGLTNFKDSINGLGDWFLKAFTQYDYSAKFDVNPFTKKQRRVIKTKFLDENIGVDERSKDLISMAKIFSDMALVYKHKSMVKSEVDTLNDILQNSKGSYKFNSKLNQLEAQQRDADRIKALADSTVLASFYGVKADDILYKSDRYFYSYLELITAGLWQSEKGKKAKELEDKISKLNTELEDDKMADSERIKKTAELEKYKNDYYKLGGRKFSTAQAIDSLISQTRFVALGLKPFAAARNLLVGKLNNYTHAQGGRDFTNSELIQANKDLVESTTKYMSFGKKETEFTRKLFGIMLDAGIAEGEDGAWLSKIVDKKTTIDQLKSLVPKAYGWLSSGDYHFKAEMLIAASRFDKIVTESGESVSFWDVVNENREYDETKYGKWDASKNDGLSFEDFYNKKILKYRQLANKLHGASGRDVYIKAKDSAIGRVVMLFKTWLPETVGVRWDPKHKDPLLDRWEEGYYRTFLRVVSEKKFGVLDMMLNAVLKKNITGITDELELSNFKKAVAELKNLVVLWMAYVILKAMAPDDDRYKKLYNLLVLRQLHDLNRDLTYYLTIDSASELQKEVLPIFRTYRNWKDAGKAISYYSLGVEKENGDLEYDFDRTALKVTKILPVLSNINTVIYYQKQID